MTVTLTPQQTDQVRIKNGLEAMLGLGLNAKTEPDVLDALLGLALPSLSEEERRQHWGAVAEAGKLKNSLETSDGFTSTEEVLYHHAGLRITGDEYKDEQAAIEWLDANLDNALTRAARAEQAAAPAFTAVA
jgi:hypothetical protein